MSKTVKNAIDTDKLLDWLVENSVLSIALEGKTPKQCLASPETLRKRLDTFSNMCWHWINKNPTLCVPGNIDQAQYCERIKGIIELLGSKLSLDELSKIWRIQVSGTVNTSTLGAVTSWCGPVGPAISYPSVMEKHNIMALFRILCCHKTCTGASCSVQKKKIKIKKIIQTQHPDDVGDKRRRAPALRASLIPRLSCSSDNFTLHNGRHPSLRG